MKTVFARMQNQHLRYCRAGSVQQNLAVQYYVAKNSGLNLAAILIGHIDNKWVYQGDGDHSGLITEVNLTELQQVMKVRLKGGSSLHRKL